MFTIATSSVGPTTFTEYNMECVQYILFSFAIITIVALHELFTYIFRTCEQKPTNYTINVDINIKKTIVNQTQCQGTKRNGNPCKQSGKPQQTGGPIINGFCSYHTPKK